MILSLSGSPSISGTTVSSVVSVVQKDKTYITMIQESGEGSGNRFEWKENVRGFFDPTEK